MRALAEDEHRSETPVGASKSPDDVEQGNPAPRVSNGFTVAPRKPGDTPGTTGARKRQQESEAQEGGLKRTFQNLASGNSGSQHDLPRRGFPSSASSETSPVKERAADGRPGLSNGTQSASAASNSTSAADIPLAGLKLAAPNVRKRDADGTTLASDAGLSSKQRLQTAEEPLVTLLEESERLRLMQMQLSDRQGSHAQASSTAEPAPASDSRVAVHVAEADPEPPHKKGSWKNESLQAIAAESLRRKLRDASPSTEEPQPMPVEAVPGSPGRRQPSEGRREPSAVDLELRSRRLLERLLLEGDQQQQQVEEGERVQSLAAQLKLGRLLGARGKPQAAFRLAEDLLLRHPADPDVLCLRGEAALALDNKAQALGSFMAALQSDAGHVDSLVACAGLYRACNLLAEAVEALQQAAAAQPDRLDLQSQLAAGMTDLGTKLKMEGAVEEGMLRYEEAIAACSSYAPAFYNMGVALSEAGDTEKAARCYARAVEIQPSHPQAHCNLGVIHKNAGRLEQAIASYRAALAAAPDFQVVAANLAIALVEKAAAARAEGDLDQSVGLLEEALVLDAKRPEALYGLAAVHAEAGRVRPAIVMYEMTLVACPRCAEAHNNLGVLHRGLGNADRSLRCFLAALQLRPNFPEALNNVAIVLTAQGQAQEAHNMLTAAIAASPTYAEAHNNLGVLQRDVGAVQEAIASYERCLELQSDARSAAQNRLLALNYIHAGEEGFVSAEHARWGVEFQAGFTQLPPLNPQGGDPERRLTVAYISPDLFTHSVSYFAEAPLTHHSPDRVKLVVYNCSPTEDAKTRRLRAAVQDSGGSWQEAAALSEQQLAQRVRDDGVDILVELTGHTAHNRLGVLAQRPAPIQATWIGYPNSTGLAAVDYRLTDAICDPLDTRQTFVEELVRLPGCFLCYTPPEDAPPIAPLPASELGIVTFGSFNALAKLTSEVLRLWARVIQAVPASRLLLKSKPFACQHSRAHFLMKLEAAGIPPDRVDLLPPTAGNAEHLATYAHMDISLDPWPYAGTTTTCESLYMGVPVISLAGSCHAHNVGASLLASLGMQDDWLAHSQEEYVALAAAAARDLPKLAELRKGLRERMLGSPLCAGPEFVAQLETVYRGWWHQWLKSERLSPSEAPEQA